MSHTHLLYHIVFTTKDRMPIIRPEWQDDLHRYLGGIVKNFEGVPIEINGIEDHVHLLVRLKAKIFNFEFLAGIKGRFFEMGQEKSFREILLAGTIRGFYCK